MKFRVEVVCLHEGGEQRCNVLEMERTELALETLGLSVAEGKAMLHGVQDFVADGIPFEHKPDSTEEDGEL
jgi:hypothetical protein